VSGGSSIQSRLLPQFAVIPRIAMKKVGDADLW
jgi:hypothetical protein